MITDIKDYLKYYIGQPCEVKRYGPGKILCAYEDGGRVEFKNGKVLSFGDTDIIPKLRRIESLTPEENKRLGKVMLNMYTGETHFNPMQFHYLLSLGVWLFDPIAFDNGLIIDAAKTESHD